MNITFEKISLALRQLSDKYGISKAILFGSRASKSNREDSDVDLIVEFSGKVTLLTISSLKYDLEDLLGIDVDIVHGPITNEDMIEIGEQVVLYAA